MLHDLRHVRRPAPRVAEEVLADEQRELDVRRRKLHRRRRLVAVAGRWRRTTVAELLDEPVASSSLQPSVNSSSNWSKIEHEMLQRRCRARSRAR